MGSWAGQPRGTASGTEMLLLTAISVTVAETSAPQAAGPHSNTPSASCEGSATKATFCVASVHEVRSGPATESCIKAEAV